MNTGPLDELSEIDAADVVRCARTLLRHPLVHEGGKEADLLPALYRHRGSLRELFAGLLGYRLVVTRRYARLFKAGPGAESTAGTRGTDGLSPRGCSYLALVAAALTGSGRQVLLSHLVAEVRADAERIGMAVADDAADRRALTAALRRLVDLGVLTETEGTVAGAAGDADAGRHQVAGEALLTIDTELLGALVAGPVERAATPEELCELAAVPASRCVELAVRRRLVEHPVVLYEDLPDEHAAWLRSHARRESWLLETYFGLRAERRAEGVLAADPEDYLSDLAFPGISTTARMASLVLPRLLASPGDPTATVDGEVLHRTCADLVAEYPSAWSKRATADLPGLVADVAGLLLRAGLAQRSGDTALRLRPPARRWAPEPDGDREPRQDPRPVPEGPGLFEIEEGEGGTR